jgi:hypothetical protein
LEELEQVSMHSPFSLQAFVALFHLHLSLKKNSSM